MRSLSLSGGKHLWDTFKKEIGNKGSGTRCKLLQYMAGTRQSDLEEGICDYTGDEDPKFKVTVNECWRYPRQSTLRVYIWLVRCLFKMLS